VKTYKSIALTVSIVYTILLVSGCGTDARPSYFTNMFIDERDIDKLSNCLMETPSVDGKVLTIKVDADCLVALSGTDEELTGPHIEVSYADLLNNPVNYLGRLVTFEAYVKSAGSAKPITLYTDRSDIDFEIDRQGKAVYVMKNGNLTREKVQHNAKYRFTCKMTEVRITEDRRHHILAEFILTTDRKIIHNPIYIENDAEDIDLPPLPN